MSKDNRFAHCYKYNREHSNRQMSLNFRIGQNNMCVFSIQNFEIHGDQLILSKTENINHHKIYSIYRNLYLFGYWCGFVTPTITVKELTTREAAIGDVYCFNKNCGGEKCVLLDTHVSTTRSFCGCWRCGAKLFVHKVRFRLDENVIWTKTDENTLFLCQKGNFFTWQASVYYCSNSINQI